MPCHVFRAVFGCKFNARDKQLYPFWIHGKQHQRVRERTRIRVELICAYRAYVCALFIRKKSRKYIAERNWRRFADIQYINIICAHKFTRARVALLFHTLAHTHTHTWGSPFNWNIQLCPLDFHVPVASDTASIVTYTQTWCTHAHQTLSCTFPLHPHIAARIRVRITPAYAQGTHHTLYVHELL